MSNKGDPAGTLEEPSVFHYADDPVDSVLGDFPSKKKKKKKPKKKVNTVAAESAAIGSNLSVFAGAALGKPAGRNGNSVLRLARNKHWKYVSSFHGQWLSLPIEMIETLFTSNASPMPGIPIDPSQAASPTPFQQHASSSSARKRRNQLDPRRFSSCSAGVPLHEKASGIATLTIPPPIDPGVFRCIKEIRRLVDEAADLALRAASGMVMPGSPFSLDPVYVSGYGGYGYGHESSGSYGDRGGNGYTSPGNSKANPGRRKSTLTTLRANKMRALAVEKLAAAYKLDEVATSVVVMKGASALEDLAERVLRQAQFWDESYRIDPNNFDALYVHFFHKKVPSRYEPMSSPDGLDVPLIRRIERSSPRQLCETTTETLDTLIAARPSNLEYFRTRGVVRCFLEQYELAIRDFTHGLVQAKQVRKMGRKERGMHHGDDIGAEVQEQQDPGFGPDHANGKTGAHSKRTKKKGVSSALTYLDDGQSGPSYSPALDDSPDPDQIHVDPAAPTQQHHSLSANAPDPIESQFIFHRASAYLSFAISTIERTVLTLEGVPFPDPSAPEIRLSMLNIAPSAEFGAPRRGWTKPKYGGLDSSTLLGPNSSAKWKAYRAALYEDTQQRRSINSMLRKSIRDFERFLSHFDSIVVSDSAAPPPSPAAGSDALNGDGNPNRLVPGSTAIPLHMTPNGALRPAYASTTPSANITPKSGGGSDGYQRYGTAPSSVPASLWSTHSQTLHKGKQVAASAEGDRPHGGTSVVVPTFAPLAAAADPSQHMNLNVTIAGNVTVDVEQLRQIVVTASPSGESEATASNAGASGSVTTTKIASVFYDALYDQLGKSPLASAIIEKLPKAIEDAAASGALDPAQFIDLLTTSHSSISITSLPKMKVAKEAVAVLPPPKWSETSLASGVAFSFFVTDCLRTTPAPGGGTVTTSTITSPTVFTSSSSSSGVNTTTTTTTVSAGARDVLPGGVVPLSPSPDLERLFPVALTTYHPLLIEAHFSILLAQLLLGEIPTLLDTFVKSAVSLDGADGYPLFSHARSMAQSDFNEILERICEAWPFGRQAKDRSGNSAAVSGAGESTATSNSTEAFGTSSPRFSTGQSQREIHSDHSPREAQSEEQTDGHKGLEAIRILLSPVYNRLKQKQQVSAAKSFGSMPLVLLFSPRVDIALAWLASVHLPHWEEAACHP